MTLPQWGSRDSSLESSFSQIASAHMDDVYNFSLYMLGNPTDAQDVTSDTFLSFYEHIGELDLTREVKPWLIKVAKNKCLDVIKKKKNIPFSEVEEQVATVPDGDPSLESMFDSNEFVAKVKEKITELNPDVRQVLLLKYFEEYTFAEIADVLEMPENTVKSHFYRAQSKLYEQLKGMEAHVS